jgi:glycerophosphoryl diester phosphodiesterase
MDAPAPSSPAPLPPAPPLLVGHRGSPRRALENTLASFDAAEAEGADGIELDVRLTQDGEAVVFHDAELVRGDRRVALAGLTLPEALDVELRKGELSGRMPALRDVFLRFGGQLRYLVEIKACPSPRPSLLEHRVARLLDSFALLEKAWVLSFSSDVLRRFKEICPGARTVLVFDGTAFRPEGRLWPDLPKGCDGIAPEAALTSEKLFSDARAAGLTTHAWTVNEPEQAARLAAWGATTIVSDDPALVRDSVKGAPETA